MADDTCDRIRELLQKTQALEERLGLTAREPRTSSKKHEPKSSKKHAERGPKSSDGKPKKKKLIHCEKPKLFGAFQFSSDEDGSMEACGPCDEGTVGPQKLPGCSMSVAYSMNYDTTKCTGRSDVSNQESMSSGSALVNETSENLSDIVPEGEVDFCPATQDSRSSSEMADKTAGSDSEQLHCLANETDSLESQNLSDLLQKASAQVIPASQKSFQNDDSDHGDEADSPEIEQLGNISPHGCPVSDNRHSSNYSHDQMLSNTTPKKVSTPQRHVFSPSLKSPMFHSKKTQQNQSSDSSNMIMDQSVVMLTDRLDRILSSSFRPKVTKKSGKASKKTSDVNRTGQNNLSKHSKGNKQDISESSNSSSSSHHQCSSVGEALAASDVSVDKSAKKVGTKATKKMGKFISSQLFSSEDESENVSLPKKPKARELMKEHGCLSKQGSPMQERVLHELQMKESVSVNNSSTALIRESAKKKQIPHGKNKKPAMTNRGLLKAVEFSSDEENPGSVCRKPNELNHIQRTKHPSSSSVSADNMSACSSQADEDIALLSQRFDSILICNNKKPANKKSKSKLSKVKPAKKVLKSAMPDLFSSSEDDKMEVLHEKSAQEASDNVGSAERQLASQAAETKSISLQVSLAFSPDASVDRSYASCNSQVDTTEKSLQVSLALTAEVSPSRAEVLEKLSANNDAGLACDNRTLATDTSDKSLQVSLASNTSEFSNRTASAEAAQMLRTVSPPGGDMTDKSLQVSLASEASEAPSDYTDKSLQVSLPSTDRISGDESATSLTMYMTTLSVAEESGSIKQRNMSLQVSLDSSNTSTDDNEAVENEGKLPSQNSASSESFSQAISYQHDRYVSETDNSMDHLLSGSDLVGSPSKAEDVLYRTALMDPDSPDNVLYKTVAEFTSFEEGENTPSVVVRKDTEAMHRGRSEHLSKNIPQIRKKPAMHRTQAPQTPHTDGENEEYEEQDKENYSPPSLPDSESDADIDRRGMLVSMEDDENFLIVESDSDVCNSPGFMNNSTGSPRAIVRPKVLTGSKAINRITFSSDDEADAKGKKTLAISESESEGDLIEPIRNFGKGPPKVRLNLGKKPCSPSGGADLKKAAIGPDEMYEESLPNLSLTKRRPHRSRQSARRVSDSSEDDLESFFQKIKPPKEQERALPRMDDFIVADDEVSSEEEESIFYIRKDRDLPTKSRTRSPIRQVTTPDVEYSEDDSDDDVIVQNPAFKTPVAPPVKPKSFTCKPQQKHLYHTPKNSLHTPQRKPLSPLDRHAPTFDRPNSTGHTPHNCGFLKSLCTNITDQKRHSDALRYVKGFKKLKEELTKKLFRMYNETVFANKLPLDLPVEWNTRLYKTAGYCTYKKYKNTNIERTCKVELSVKVCDSAERVRDTLIHELCHAAVWLFYGKTDGHGHHWKHWAHKANLIHPDLPVISRCHSYDIHTKYTYKCMKCGYQIGRHSKSLDTEKKVCGYCHGTFQLLHTKSKSEGAPQPPRTPNRFAMFVKENYGTVKKQHRTLSHKDVMQKLSAEFALKGKIAQ